MYPQVLLEAAWEHSFAADSTETSLAALKVYLHLQSPWQCSSLGVTVGFHPPGAVHTAHDVRLELLPPAMPLELYHGSYTIQSSYPGVKALQILLRDVHGVQTA